METVIDNTSVKKYPAYKDSGVEWLRRIQQSTLGKFVAHCREKFFKDVPIKKFEDDSNLPIISVELSYRRPIERSS